MIIKIVTLVDSNSSITGPLILQRERLLITTTSELLFVSLCPLSQ